MGQDLFKGETNMTKRSKEETMKELLEVRMKMRKHYDKWRDVTRRLPKRRN